MNKIFYNIYLYLISKIKYLLLNKNLIKFSIINVYCSILSKNEFKKKNKSMQSCKKNNKN